MRCSFVNGREVCFAQVGCRTFRYVCRHTHPRKNEGTKSIHPGASTTRALRVTDTERSYFSGCNTELNNNHLCLLLLPHPPSSADVWGGGGDERAVKSPHVGGDTPNYKIQNRCGRGRPFPKQTGICSPNAPSIVPHPDTQRFFGGIHTAVPSTLAWSDVCCRRALLSVFSSAVQPFYLLPSAQIL